MKLGAAVAKGLGVDVDAVMGNMGATHTEKTAMETA
jgi:hypothetical protein